MKADHSWMIWQAPATSAARHFLQPPVQLRKLLAIFLPASSALVQAAACSPQI